MVAPCRLPITGTEIESLTLNRVTIPVLRGGDKSQPGMLVLVVVVSVTLHLICAVLAGHGDLK